MSENYTSTSFLQLITSYLSKEKKDVAAIYIYSLLSGLVYLSLPLGIQAIVSFSMGGVFTTSVYVITIFVIIGTIIVGYLKIQIMNIVEKIQQKIFVQYSIAYAEKLNRIDISKTNKYNLSELMNRVFDAVTLQKGISKILLDIPIETIRIIIGIIVLGFYHPWFIVFGLLIIGLVVTIFKYTSIGGIKSSIEESNKKYEVVSWLESVAGSIRSLKPYATYELPLQKIDSLLENYIQNRTKHYRILLFQYKTIIAFKVITTMVMLVLCTYLLINQKLNIGAFIAAELVIMTIISAVEKLVISLESYYDVITSFTKLNKVLELPDEPSGKYNFPKKENGIAIEAKNIAFSFDNEINIIENIYFSIQANSITVVSGNLSSGKTTLSKILSAAYTPTNGILLYDNIPSQNFVKSELTSAIGYYDDEHKLFAGSILDNIQVGNKLITIELINKLCQEWGISNIFYQFPNSYYSDIQDYPTKLTYSTRKAIQLLKVCLGKHNIILLDEPLEGMSETFKINFLKYIQYISKHKTVIIVTNDENIINMANHHFKMQQGLLTIIK